MKKLFYSCTILALLSVVWFSCRKAITIDELDREFPIQLTATIEGDSVVLSWNMERTAQFQRLIVVRTSAPINKGLSPFNLPDVKFILDSGEDDIERLVELTPLFQQKSYYKVYVMMEGRFVESNNASVTRNIFLENGRPEMVLMHPDSNWAALILVFDFQPSEVILVDLNDGKIKGKHVISGGFSWVDASMTFKRYQGKEYLIVASGYNSRYVQLELPSLFLKEEKSFPYSTWSVLGAKTNNFIFMAHSDITNAFVIREINNIATVYRGFENPVSYNNYKRMFFLDADQNKIVEISEFKMRRMKVTTDGMIDSSYYKSTFISGNLVPNWSQIPISPNGSYFIPNLNGTIYDQDLNIVKQIEPETQQSFVDFCFSPDNNFVYVVDWSFATGFITRIRKINILTLETVDSIVFTEIIPRRLVLNAKNELVLWCNSEVSTSTFSYKTLYF